MTSPSRSSSTLRVFLDTEFTDFIGADLISIGLKAETGEEFYGENLDFNRKLASQFVVDNVYPLLDHDKYGLRELELAARVGRWLEDLPCERIEVFVDYPTDWELLCGLLRDDLPKFATEVNFTVLLETQCLLAAARAGDTGAAAAARFARARDQFYREFLAHFQETGEAQHHALSDARANLRGFLAAEATI